jgi:hypothetical protein
MGPLMGPHDPIWGQWNPIRAVWGLTSGRARASAHEWAGERASERARAGSSGRARSSGRACRPRVNGRKAIASGGVWGGLEIRIYLWAPYGAPYGPIWAYGLSWSP